VVASGMWWLALSRVFAGEPSVLPSPLAPIAVDRAWDVLPAPGADLRPAYRVAGEKLGGWTISVAEVEVDGARLVALAGTAPDEPFTRVLREGLRRPVDPVDLLYLLDDVLAASDRRGQRFVVTQSRARDLGVLVHPDEVFKQGVVQSFPGKATVVEVDDPPPQDTFPAAVDGEVLGPNWTMRYRPPTDREAMFAGIAGKRPDYAVRVRSLVQQLEAQGCDVSLTSFLRFPERGYLMWGAFELKRASLADQPGVLERLRAAGEAWGHVPIAWSHPDGPEATKEAARRMADVYGVVYATETGARTSRHYEGKATDFTALGLPRALTLTAPDGATRTFDLSGPDEPRDLSLTPAVIAWIEEHFHMAKLRSDHPHWEDAAESP
jgi:hypothetical protein